MSRPVTSFRYRLTPGARTESKARLLRLRRGAIYIRGDSFDITFNVHNPMTVDFPGGKFDAFIVYPSKQAEYVRDLAIPRLPPGRDWQSNPTEFNALAEGYALVYLGRLDVQGERGRWVNSEGRDIWSARWQHTDAIHGFHVETRRDYHTYFALVVSAVSLIILISERVYSTLLDAATRTLYGPVLLTWYMILVVAGLVVVFTEGGDC
jgi:hypothetical protein